MRVARQAIRFLQNAIPTSKTGAVILAYHLVGSGTRAAVDIDPDTFCLHLDQILDRANPVSLRDALGAEENGSNRVVVAFDDAFENFFQVAWPILSDSLLGGTPMGTSFVSLKKYLMNGN